MNYQALVVLAIAGWVFAVLFGVMCGVILTKWQRAIDGWAQALADTMAACKIANRVIEMAK